LGFLGHRFPTMAPLSPRTQFYADTPWKVYAILVALILSYFGKYFCTSFLYIVQELWRKDQDILYPNLANMFILGYVMSMIGKMCAGYWSDEFGGKRVLILASLSGITIVTMFSFASSFCEAVGIDVGDRYPVYLVLWLANGFFLLGLSWVAVMAVATNWIPQSAMGRLMAVVGCAPELGDASARLFLSPIVQFGWLMGGSGFGSPGHWQTVALSAAIASLFMTLPMIFFVAETPESEAVTQNIKQKKKDQKGYFARVWELFRSNPLMTLTCIMCGLLYAIRTMFLLYSVTWLNLVYCHHYHPNTPHEVCKVDPVTDAAVGQASLLFTFFGMFSVLLSGYLKDAWPKRQRALILLVNCVLLLLVLLYMHTFNSEISFFVAAVLVGLIGFGDFGPYKTMSGAFAVDIGGKSLKATVSSFMGVASNGGAALVLAADGYVHDWTVMFLILIWLSIGCIACAAAIYLYDLKTIPPAKEVKSSGKHLIQPLVAPQ